MYIESEFMLLEANNEQLARENKRLAEALEKIDQAWQKPMGPLGATWEEVAARKINELGEAIIEAQEILDKVDECTCLPDLPDGRSRGHCYAHKIYIGGE